jgi:hypothetical protein
MPNLYDLLNDPTFISTGIVIVVIVALAVLLSRSLRVAWRLATPQVESVRPATQPMPLTVAQMDVRLLAFGFSPLGGATEVRLRNNPKSAYVWEYISSGHAVRAELIPTPHPKIPVFVGFSTYFSDHAFIATAYPYGENIDMEQFQSHYCTSDVESAWQYHRTQVSEQMKTHGAPVPLYTFDDLRIQDQVQLQYHRVQLRRQIRGNLLQALADLCFGIGALSTVLLILNQTWLYGFIVLDGIALVLGFVTVSRARRDLYGMPPPVHMPEHPVIMEI